MISKHKRIRNYLVCFIMSYKFREFKTQEEIDTFFSKLSEQIRDIRNLDEYIIDWYKKDGIKIYGYFYESSRSLICYGQTISPEKIKLQSRPGIFAKLPNFGSSRKYLGLKDHFGNDLLENKYEEIKFFYQTDRYAYFTIKKYGKVGIFRYSINSSEIIVPPQYDSIFDAREYTWGYIIDNNVGFMTTTGQQITKAQYINEEGLNLFVDGKALTQQNKPDTCKVYIDHYGNVIDFHYEEEGTFSGNGKGFYPFDDLPDKLDAYEGTPSNLWNTD